MTEKNMYQADLTQATKDNTYYALAMFPYPSGAGLHVGHGSNFTANDIIARYKRMQGYHVINPMGWDSFGLPTENYAMKLGRSASEVTAENIANYKNQCTLMDWSYDWDREITTSSPEYYKRTQRIFQKLFAAGLVYKKDSYVNRCPVDQTVLANDQVVDGCCERCGTEIIQKKHPQRFIKITDYADRLINDLDLVDRPEETKTQQKYWIGKSEGAEIDFAIDGGENKITVFTTRPDTVFGVTALVLAPENASVDAYIPTEYKSAIEEYRLATSKKTNIERQQDAETKSGVFSGVYAMHPLTGEKIPVWFADYVLPDYATGAVMFVPAHDQRDWAFAKKHGLNIKQVILPAGVDKQRVDLMLSIADEIFNLAANTDCDVYLSGGIILPYIAGVIYRTHHDLDFALRSGDMQKYIDVLKNAGYILLQQKENGVYMFEKHGIQIELGDDAIIPGYIPFHDNYDADEKVLWGHKGKVLDFSFTAAVKREQAKVKQREKDIIDVQYLDNGAYTSSGLLINSQQFDGLDNTVAKQAIIEHLEKNGLGKKKITYKLRDWSVSRQRYWGSPIPVYYTFDDPQYNAYNPHPDKAKWIPHLIPEEQLPVVLPLDLGNYKPAGKSPLADHPTFPYYNAPDGNVYLRECDTLDTFMCSSFYYLRFVDPQNERELISKELAAKALPVDFYIGGKEHIYGHLLYSRFIHKFLFDQGVVDCAEPFQKLFHQGMILGPDGRKMSKRRGNVVTPEDLVNKYGAEMGADVLRTYTMFMGPLEVEKPWNDNAVDGVKRFLDRVVRMKEFLTADDGDQQTTIQLHKTIKGVSEDIEKLKFNTAVSKMMVFVNHIYDVKKISTAHMTIFLKLLAPFATKLTQQLRANLGHEGNIHITQRPMYDDSLLATDTLQLPVQIGGKMRGTIEVPYGVTQDDVMNMITADEKLSSYLLEKEIKKIIYVQDKIINLILA